MTSAKIASRWFVFVVTEMVTVTLPALAGWHGIPEFVGLWQDGPIVRFYSDAVLLTFALLPSAVLLVRLFRCRLSDLAAAIVLLLGASLIMNALRVLTIHVSVGGGDTPFIDISAHVLAWLALIVYFPIWGALRRPLISHQWSYGRRRKAWGRNSG